jgi:hypothetical protein
MPARTTRQHGKHGSPRRRGSGLATVEGCARGPMSAGRTTFAGGHERAAEPLGFVKLSNAGQSP